VKTGSRTRTSFSEFALAFLISLVSPAQEAAPGKHLGVPDDFPRFLVPGHEPTMQSLRELFWLHYQPAGPLIPLWDEWMPM
jgi:hypothetical protein